MRRVCSFLLFAALVLLASPSQLRQSYLFNYKLRTVVIDAGHGGHDAGCHGSSAYEKNVTLAVALKLGALIEKNLPGTKVIYTRKTDEFIELHERANIANRNNADLFISIHCNANKNAEAYGTESWTMGLHKTEGNLEVAKRENSAILKEKDYLEKYDGFDPNSPEAYIIFSLNQNAFINQSLLLASNVEHEFQNDKRSSRGVKQAGFLVLWRTVMPSILIETGFLTNRSEEKYLNSEAGQNECARSVFDAVVKYKSKMENTVNGMFNENDRTLTGNPEMANDMPIATNNVIKKDTLKETPNDKSVSNEALKLEKEKQPTEASTKALTGTTYRLQLAASSKQIDVKSNPYNKVTNIVCEKDASGTYRVLTPHLDTIEAAKAVRADLQKAGFKDAFIVEYVNGLRTKALYN